MIYIKTDYDSMKCFYNREKECSLEARMIIQSQFRSCIACGLLRSANVEIKKIPRPPPPKKGEEKKK